MLKSNYTFNHQLIFSLSSLPQNPPVDQPCSLAPYILVMQLLRSLASFLLASDVNPTFPSSLDGGSVLNMGNMGNMGEGILGVSPLGDGDPCVVGDSYDPLDCWLYNVS